MIIIITIIIIVIIIHYLYSALYMALKLLTRNYGTVKNKRNIESEKKIKDPKC